MIDDLRLSSPRSPLNLSLPHSPLPINKQDLFKADMRQCLRFQDELLDRFCSVGELDLGDEDNAEETRLNNISGWKFLFCPKGDSVTGQGAYMTKPTERVRMCMMLSCLCCFCIHLHHPVI